MSLWTSRQHAVKLAIAGYVITRLTGDYTIHPLWIRNCSGLYVSDRKIGLSRFWLWVDDGRTPRWGL
jgi:hypothetical protein